MNNPNPKKDNILWMETPKTAQQRIEQARKLKKQAKTGGLKFEAYLTSDLAEWVLDMVEKGDFADPCEAVFVFMGQAKELDECDDLKLELLKKRINKGVKDIEEGRTYSAEEVENYLEKAINEKTEPAVWKKIEQPVPKE